MRTYSLYTQQTHTLFVHYFLHIQYVLKTLMCFWHTHTHIHICRSNLRSMPWFRAPPDQFGQWRTRKAVLCIHIHLQITHIHTHTCTYIYVGQTCEQCHGSERPRISSVNDEYGRQFNAWQCYRCDRSAGSSARGFSRYACIHACMCVCVCVRLEICVNMRVWQCHRCDTSVGSSACGFSRYAWCVYVCARLGMCVNM